MPTCHELIISIAGGVAGIVEAASCQPLDTIKTRMQLARRAVDAKVRSKPSLTFAAPQIAESLQSNAAGFIRTGTSIVRAEGFLGLYQGLSAVVLGMGPKIAIRFASFEWYKSLLTSPEGKLERWGIFLAGLGAGGTEAVSVVNPMEVMKIRLQAQKAGLSSTGGSVDASLADVFRMTVSKEGLGALYKGASLTALRQGTNQAVNFSVYSLLKEQLQQFQPELVGGNLPSYQTAVIGLISGTCGPLCNAPIDTVKTRLQNSNSNVGQSKLQQSIEIMHSTVRHEGARALYKGIGPRILRVAPGQSVSFMVFELVKGLMDRQG